MSKNRVRSFNIVLEYGARCHYCREMTNDKLPKNHPLFRTMEHIVPKSIGGPAWKWNLVIACYKCNSEMGNKRNKCHCSICLDAWVRFELNQILRDAQKLFA